MQRALRRCAVPSVYQGRDSVFLSPAAADLYQLLLAVMHPASERHLRAAMATTIMQMRASELHALFADPDRDLPMLQDDFDKYCDILRRYGPLPMFRRLVA